MKSRKSRVTDIVDLFDSRAMTADRNNPHSHRIGIVNYFWITEKWVGRPQNFCRNLVFEYGSWI